MNLVMRGLNVAVSEAIRTHVERRLTFAIGRFADQVRQVNVRLSHGSAHGRGLEKRCQIEIRMRSHGPVWVDGVDSDLFTAIDLASDRIGYVLAREIAKARPPVRQLARAS